MQINPKIESKSFNLANMALIKGVHLERKSSNSDTANSSLDSSEQSNEAFEPDYDPSEDN